VGFAVCGLRFAVWGLVFGIWCLGFEGLGFGVWGLGFGVWGLRVWSLGFGFRCLDADLRQTGQGLRGRALGQAPMILPFTSAFMIALFVGKKGGGGL